MDFFSFEHRNVENIYLICEENWENVCDWRHIEREGWFWSPRASIVKDNHRLKMTVLKGIKNIC